MMKTKHRITAVCLMICLFSAVISLFAVSAQAAESTHTITFDVQGIGETPAPVTVSDGECYLYLRENDHGQNPTADGYVFHCWVTTLDFEQDEVAMSNTAAYLETPIYDDITLYAVWYKIVDGVSITVDPPVAGDVIGTKRYETEDYSFDYQYPRPHVTVNTEGVRVEDYSWDMSEKSAYWLSDPDDRESTFEGTFEDGKEYGVEVFLEPIFGYQFADQLTITFNGTTWEKQYSDYNLCIFTAPVWCGVKPPDPDKPSKKDDTKTEKDATADEATKDQSTKDQSSSSSTNTHAVQTGDYGRYFIIFLVILPFAAVIILRRKTILKK